MDNISRFVVGFAYFMGGHLGEMNKGEHTMNFSQALEDAESGAMIQRSGWNVKGLAVGFYAPTQGEFMNLPYMFIEYPDGRRYPWLASQTDIASSDWSVVNKQLGGE